MSFSSVFSLQPHLSTFSPTIDHEHHPNNRKPIIYWSEEDQVYLAEVPELPGCIAHGDSYESALANAKEAIQLWIDTAKEFGDPIPEPKGRRLMYA